MSSCNSISLIPQVWHFKHVSKVPKDSNTIPPDVIWEVAKSGHTRSPLSPGNFQRHLQKFTHNGFPQPKCCLLIAYSSRYINEIGGNSRITLSSYCSVSSSQTKTNTTGISTVIILRGSLTKYHHTITFIMNGIDKTTAANMCNNSGGPKFTYNPNHSYVK
jgi:hypothetical protein